MKSHAYLYTIHTTDDMPCALGDLHTADITALDSPGMIPIETKGRGDPLFSSKPNAGQRALNCRVQQENHRTLGHPELWCLLQCLHCHLAPHWPDHRPPASFTRCQCTLWTARCLLRYPLLPRRPLLFLVTGVPPVVEHLGNFNILESYDKGQVL